MQDKKVFKVGLIYFISTVLFLLIKLFYNLNLLNFLGINSALIINVFVQVGVMFLIPALLYMLLFKAKPKKIIKEFKFSKISFKTVLLSFATGFVMFLCVVFISIFASSVLHIIGYNNPFAQSNASAGGNVWSLLIIPVLTSAVLPGFCEEFLNRGLLFGSLKEDNPRRAILISALLFALLHYNINQAVYAFCVGLLLGAVTYFSCSIWPAMIIHFTNNFLSTYFTYAKEKQIFGRNFYVLISNLFTGNLISVIVRVVLVLVAVGLLLYYLINELFESTRANRVDERLKSVAKMHLGEPIKTKHGDKFESQGEVNSDLFIKLQNEFIKCVVQESGEAKFIDRIVPKKISQKTKPISKIFLYSSVFITATLTIFTLIWGLL